MDFKIKNLELETLKVMASGHYYLALTSNISWDAFPDYADKFLKIIHGKVIERIDLPSSRIWRVTVNGIEVRLVYDDFPEGVSLESLDGKGDIVIREVFNKLSKS